MIGVTSSRRYSIVSSSLPNTQIGETAAEQVAELMDQLRAKDTLVLQLTERLEQAAEQLDRLHRSGADRRHSSSGSGGGLEPLTTKIDEAIDAWTQTGPQFDYIVQRLDEIAGALQGGSIVSHDHKPGAKSAAPTAHVTASAPAPAGSGAAGGSFWEKMKSSMMDGSPMPAAAAAPPPVPSNSAAPSHETEGNPEQVPANDLAQRISAPAPVIIDIETASIEELREAITMRDNYITALISELRTAEPMPELPSDLKSSGLAPEDLVARLLDLENRVKTKVLREELDLSLERARIARERVKLDQVKAHLENQIRRLTGGGADAPAAANNSSTSAPADDVATGKMSWLKRLKGNK